MFKIGVCYDDGLTNQKYFAYFNDIEGFNGDRIIDFENEIYQIKLLNGSLSPEFQEHLMHGIKKLPENIYLVILDEDDKSVGSFFLATVNIIDTVFNLNKTVNLTLNAFMHSAEPGRYKSWEMKMSGEINNKNKWLELKPSERQGWLEMAIKCNQNIQGRGQHVIVDGTFIEDRDSFYCALGEAINGPGGYFGRNLHALNDCLCGDFGPIPKSIKWKNSRISQSKIQNFEEFIDLLSEIFAQNDIDFILT